MMDVQPNSTLPDRIAAAADVGFPGVEIQRPMIRASMT